MRISGVELITMFILQILFKVLVGTGVYYLLKWLCGDMDIKMIIFLYIAIQVGMQFKLKFSLRG